MRVKWISIYQQQTLVHLFTQCTYINKKTTGSFKRVFSSPTIHWQFQMGFLITKHSLAVSNGFSHHQPFTGSFKRVFTSPTIHWQFQTGFLIPNHSLAVSDGVSHYQPFTGSFKRFFSSPTSHWQF